jgi:hypothetical protein
MTSSSGTQPTDQSPQTMCGQCGQPMRCIGRLPPRGARSALDVFRCFGCDNVVSKPK